VFVKLQFDMHI